MGFISDDATTTTAVDKDFVLYSLSSKGAIGNQSIELTQNFNLQLNVDYAVGIPEGQLSDFYVGNQPWENLHTCSWSDIGVDEVFAVAVTDYGQSIGYGLSTQQDVITFGIDMENCTAYWINGMGELHNWAVFTPNYYILKSNGESNWIEYGTATSGAQGYWGVAEGSVSLFAMDGATKFYAVYYKEKAVFEIYVGSTHFDQVKGVPDLVDFDVGCTYNVCYLVTENKDESTNVFSFNLKNLI